MLLCWRPSCQVMCTVPISNLGTVLCSLLLILCSLRLCAFLFVDMIFRYFVGISTKPWLHIVKVKSASIDDKESQI